MKSFLISSFLIISFISFSQEKADYSQWCHTQIMWNKKLKSDANFREQVRLDSLTRTIENQFSLPVAPQKGTIYKIPIVFHILHNGGAENISEEQIMSAFYILNEDFRAQNSDTANVVPAFKSIIGDAEIEFVMATKAPDGTCFKGYTRTKSPQTFDGGFDDGGGDAQVDAVRNGNDIYQGNWPSNKYLNVYIVADAGGAGGYTNYPSGTSTDMSNGIWLLHTQFGSVGTSYESRSLTHEVGHWLNLMHTWGNSNNPGIASNCSIDDDVTDTPICTGVTGCLLNDNGCGPLANIQNYMEYSFCSYMFTQGQVTRMRTALLSSVGLRNNLWTAQNLQETGADGSTALCVADFSADKAIICVGDTIYFSDDSFHNVTSRTWSFPGGNPSSITDENPTVIYNTPGIYNVSLTVSDGTNSMTESKNSYIVVLGQGQPLPILEGFENINSFSSSTSWFVNNIDNAAYTWEIDNAVGLSSSKSAKIENFNLSSGYTNELISENIDLSNLDPNNDNITLSFRYAYKRKVSTDDDWLRVLISKDCGKNWVIRKTLHAYTLNNDFQNSFFTPSDSDWITVHMTNITSSYFVNNFRYKFQFESGGGNNFYLDNINLYSGAPSDELVGLGENESLSSVTLYPNPTRDEINISFSTKTTLNTMISIQDITGKHLKSDIIHANTGKNIININTAEFSSGIYFLTIQASGSKKTVRFTILEK